MSRLRITLVRGTVRHELARTAANPAEGLRIAREAAECLAHVAELPWRVELVTDDGTVAAPPCHVCGGSDATPEPWEIRACAACGEPTCWRCRALDLGDCDDCHEALATHVDGVNRRTGT